MKKWHWYDFVFLIICLVIMVAVADGVAKQDTAVRCLFFVFFIAIGIVMFYIVEQRFDAFQKKIKEMEHEIEDYKQTIEDVKFYLKTTKDRISRLEKNLFGRCEENYLFGELSSDDPELDHGDGTHCLDDFLERQKKETIASSKKWP